MKMRTEIAAGVAAAIMISLVGCGSSDVPAGPPEIEATDIAIVSGYHQNAVTPPINNSEILKAFEYSTRNNGSVTIVVNDGDPAAVVDFEIDESAVSGLSEARLEQQISEVIDSTNNALASSKANDPEVDTFEAIKQAARGLTGEAGDKCLYILDSGLSTEGELNVLSENLHRLIDVQPIVDKLQKDHALPDLTGVQVVWIGLGDAADKQEDLTSRNKNTLKELWEAVLTTSGAEVTFKNLPLTEEGSTDRELPEVTPIPIVHDSNDFDPLQVNQVMLNDFGGADKVYLACGYTDLRKGIDGLATMVQQQFELDPFTNTLFLFCGRKRDRIKGLYWERDGFILLYKRLEQGAYQWPRSEAEVKLLTPQQ